MKKIFTILCAAVIAASAVNAEVLLTEHFAQTTETLGIGDNLGAAELGEDNTAWYNLSGSGQIYMNTTKDLTFAGYKSATDNTGSAEYKATSHKVARAFKAVNSGSVFMSAIINVTGATGSATARDYISALCTKTNSFSNANNHYLRIEYQAEGDGYKLGIAKQAESAAFISYTGEMTFGKNYLVVAEYRWVDGEKNDSVFLYINPTKDGKADTTLVCKQSATNASGGEAGSGTKADADQLTSVMLYASSSTKQSMFIDELKVTTAWADLFEAGDAPVVETPTISTESSVAFGEVTTGVEAVKTVTVQGSYLAGAISVASSDEQVAVSATSISKEEAEAEGGYTLSLTLTAAAAGSGSANITLSSEGASNQVISVSWTAVAPTPKVANIAALKAYTVGEAVVLESEPVVVGFIDYNPVLQDESGAIIVQDLFEAGGYGYYMLAVGDKVSGLSSLRIDEEDYLRGFPTVTITGDVTVASKNNKLTPIAVSVADAMSYGPAYIQLTQVTFTDTEKTEFAAEWFNIAQGNATARIQVPAGCDIIGEAIPDKADIVGNVIYTTGGIAISASADVTNRVARTATGISTVKSQGKAVKTVRDGQIVILRDGKAFNVLGSEL
ncbi:MAG: hypothetical protein IJ249_02680 [Paludibacteraceae bacterium]|nr:hypothetical protein [Paludibacteraceae bacterium]